MKHEQTNKHTYNLFNTVTIIVSIVIGSGIYFKADDILNYTNGNVLLGAIVLCIGAISIIFGALSLSELSKKMAVSGGLTGYFESFISPKFATGYGWFQLFMHIPGLIVVVSWVCAIYTFITFGIETTLEWQIILGFIYILLFIGLNLLSQRLTTHFQTLSTVIKLIPLFIIAIAGLFWSKEVPELPQGISQVVLNNGQWAWLSALVPLAFAYDGWTVSLAISSHVKHPQKNMTRALIIAPLIILFTYLMYFLGMTRILGSDFIVSTGNGAVIYGIEMVLGTQLSKFMTLIVTISILGVLNGLILSAMQLHQVLVEKKMIALSKKQNNKNGLTLSIALQCLAINSFWLVIHYITQKYNLLDGRDISEVSIVFNYLCCILLYVVVFKLYKNKQIKNILTGFISPIFAIFGSLLIFIGSLLASFTYISLLMMICFIIVIVGYRYRSDQK